MLLEVNADHIAQLDDTDLRTLVAFLCELEVTKQQHSASAVTWGGDQNAADGGIDVRISLSPGATISGYVPRPATGFQTKAQDMPRGAILQEMAPGGVLLDSIAELARAGGAYIIVSSNGSLSDTALKNRRAAMTEAFAALPAAAALVVDFYDRRRVASWVNQHPGVVSWVRQRVGQPIKGWRPFQDWSSSPAPIEEPYLLDERIRLVGPSVRDSAGLSASEAIKTLRAILAKPKGIVRLVGLSGVGKTRLIQALFDNRVGEMPLPRAGALYADISDGPDPVPLEMLSSLISLNRRAVMIIDNCGAELHRTLAAQIARVECALSLITVEYDINDDEPENTDVFKLDPASESLIEKILEKRYPAIADPSRRVIARFSAGNARVAFALAATAKSGESLANLHDGELFRRLFEQAKESSEELFDSAKACALLYSFDGETLDGGDSELVPLAKLAGVTVDQLHKHVAELHRRQLVQKRGKWRAILPHALAHRLAKWALEDIPFRRIEDAIVKGASPRMLRSFSRRMGYLHDDARAVALAASWFGDGGLLSALGRLNDVEDEILENIAPVDPAATLAFFERAALGNEGFFGVENENRKQIVRITRSIAYDAALFDRCVSLLKRFVLAEKPEEHDSALDPLKSLFFLYLSGTHATPTQRAAFIQQLLDAASQPESALGVALLEAMLESGHFTSHYSFEFGARKRDYGAHPNRGSEIKEWYASAIEVARNAGMASSAVTLRVRRVFAHHIPQLLGRVGTFDEVISVVDQFAARSGWPEGWIGVRGAMRRGKDTLPQPVLKRLEEVERRLRPRDLAAMLRSYALSPEWGALDIADFEEDEEQKPFEARQRIYDLCTDLGQQLGRDPDQLKMLLPEILAAEAQKTFALGNGLAAGCASLAECWTLLKDAFLASPEQERKAQTLGGFAAGAMQRSPADAQSLLTEALREPRLHKQLVYLETCAGVTGGAFDRLMEAVDLDTVPLDSFIHIAGGRAHEGLDDHQFLSLVTAITNKDGGWSTAAQIIEMRIFGALTDKRPIGEPVKDAGRQFLATLPLERGASRLDHAFGDIVAASFDKPEHEALARQLCGRILDGVKSHQLHAWDVGETIKALTKTFPIAVLDVLVEQQDPEVRFGRSIFRDVRSHRTCPLDEMPMEIWTTWAAQKESRYVDLAEVVRFSSGDDDEHSKGWSEAAQKLINTAPDPRMVLDAFLGRFEPTGWSGSRADIMASRAPLIDALMNHPRKEVAVWAKEKAPVYAAEIERERGYEARESKQRDETFE